MTKQSVLNWFAVEEGYEDWNSFYNHNNGKIQDEDLKELMERYAKAKLEEAAENATVIVSDVKPKIGRQSILSQSITVDKQSILNTPLD